MTFLPNDPASLRSYYLLDPAVTFLNHGSFGACPIPVFQTYQQWQLELERQPVQFMKYRINPLLAEARDLVAAYVNAPSEDCVFVPNATAGVHIASHSLSHILQPGDEVLTSTHEYGVCLTIWQDVCDRVGARLVRVTPELPYVSDETFIEAFWEHVTPRTKVIFLSHITSATALTFPVQAICARARAEGILTLIDGAHAPGQIPLDITAIDPDYYGGNCHKWMCAPKGSGFLYVRKDRQTNIRPLYLSWGWRDDADFTTRFHEQGTRDPASFLSIPAALTFMREHDWAVVQARSHALAQATRQKIHDIFGMTAITPSTMPGQMTSISLPNKMGAEKLKEVLYDTCQIEIPVLEFEGQLYARVSIQGYNTEEDAQKLVDALEEILT